MTTKWFTTIGAFATFMLFGMTAQAGNVILNGDFETGDLINWTPFTTGNGLNGSGLPDVVGFDTTGSGASLAAHFNAGENAFTGAQEGGGLTQSFTLASGGVYSVFANIASQDPTSVNADAGNFSILIDNTVVASQALGAFASLNQTIRGTLSSNSVSLTSGLHTFEVLVTRRFLSNGSATPQEYFDNISLSANASGVPEPSMTWLLGAGLCGLGAVSRKFGRK